MSTSFVSSWFTTARDALSLKPEPFERLGRGRASIRQGITVVVIVGLIIGVVAALVALPGMLRSPAAAVDDVFSGIEQGLEQFQSFGGQLPPGSEQVMDVMKQSFESMRPFIQELITLPTPLPPFFGRFFPWLGILLSSPFALLAQWLSISIWIMLFARLLGGRGGLVHYLNASALSVIPHLLGVFGFIPCAGAVLGLIGAIWGLAMQYKAVQVTHGLSQGRSLAAVLLPYILLMILVGLFAALLAFGIAGIAGAGAD